MDYSHQLEFLESLDILRVFMLTISRVLSEWMIADWLLLSLSCWLRFVNLIIQIVEYELYEVKYVHQHLIRSFSVLVVAVYVLTLLFAFDRRFMPNAAGSRDSVRFSKIVQRDYHDNTNYVIPPRRYRFTRKLECISNLRLVVTTNKRVFIPGEHL